MSKSTADENRQEFMREINGGRKTVLATCPSTMHEFLEQVYLPFYCRKWKESTKMTTERRSNQHIIGDLGTVLQQFL